MLAFEKSDLQMVFNENIMFASLSFHLVAEQRVS